MQGIRLILILSFIGFYFNPSLAVGFPLLTAVQQRDVNLVRTLLARPETNVNQENLFRQTPLFYAAMLGHADVVKALLEHPRINVNTITIDGENNPLAIAILKAPPGYLDVVKALLEDPRINVNIHRMHLRYSVITAPLIIAAEKGDVDVVKALIEHPLIDVNVKTYGGRTALIIATEGGDVDVVKALIEHDDTCITMRDRSGRTALSIAEEKDHSEIANMISAEIVARSPVRKKPLPDVPAIRFYKWIYESVTAMVGRAD